MALIAIDLVLSDRGINLPPGFCANLPPMSDYEEGMRPKIPGRILFR